MESRPEPVPDHIGLQKKIRKSRTIFSGPKFKLFPAIHLCSSPAVIGTTAQFVETIKQAWARNEEDDAPLLFPKIKKWLRVDEEDEQKTHSHLLLVLDDEIKRKTYEGARLNGVLFNQLKQTMPKEWTEMAKRDGITIKYGKYTYRIISYLFKKPKTIEFEGEPDSFLGERINAEIENINQTAHYQMVNKRTLPTIEVEETIQPTTDKKDKEDVVHACVNNLDSMILYSDLTMLVNGLFDFKKDITTTDISPELIAGKRMLSTCLAEVHDYATLAVKEIRDPKVLLEYATNFLNSVHFNDHIRTIWKWVKTRLTEKDYLNRTALCLSGPSQSFKTTLIELFFPASTEDQIIKASKIVLDAKFQSKYPNPFHPQINFWIQSDLPQNFKPELLNEIKSFANNVASIDIKYESGLPMSKPLIFATVANIREKIKELERRADSTELGKEISRRLTIVETKQIPNPETYSKVFGRNNPKLSCALLYLTMMHMDENPLVKACDAAVLQVLSSFTTIGGWN